MLAPSGLSWLVLGVVLGEGVDVFLGHREDVNSFHYSFSSLDVRGAVATLCTPWSPCYGSMWWHWLLDVPGRCNALCRPKVDPQQPHIPHPLLPLVEANAGNLFRRAWVKTPELAQ